MSQTNQNQKVAIVTGGASGIGRATALRFAQMERSNSARCLVVVADQNSVDGQHTVDLIREQNGNGYFFCVDVSEAEEMKALVKSTMETFGRLDYAHNNAGISGEKRSIIDCSEENWDRVISVNLKGVWLGMKYQIPAMIKSGGGAIVNTSSILGFQGAPGIPAYGASKHAVIGLTKTAALEFAQHNIRVNTICPGAIRTPMISPLTGDSDEGERQFTRGHPFQRMGTPSEIAEAVVWLCSDSASFVTGQVLTADGGYTLQ
ncbi:short chain dehydrogenase [Candidatus Poribacteria bacterium]|nr:short chain dehydrogenase [Candidatus Poribacteria bacterium]MEE2911066.1 glucose 1-dehydrogenase [Candidatus Poribacteria bacterium]